MYANYMVTETKNEQYFTELKTDFYKAELRTVISKIKNSFRLFYFTSWSEKQRLTEAVLNWLFFILAYEQKI